ncbi:4-hydroxythreonine-4-phosphate dehydrogenase PdxA [Spiribacter sp. 218]|jgi:4-hydroxythreonine-4-phosphate dehydrogenase|uniref:4-hydroxythreonine-4-phosphate dehydrogenase PdxA n=1 Tax=Spiribacter pallidus TaxID=1987936 RepID=UPI00349F39D1
MSDRPCIALTPGEPAGVGPELIASLAEAFDDCRLVAVTDPALLTVHGIRTAEYHPATPADPGVIEVLPVPTNAPVSPGHLDRHNADHVLATLRRAAQGCLDDEFQAMVTGPVHKGVINDAGYRFSGHTEFLAEFTKADLPVMMLVAGGLRVALVTTHLPLQAVPEAITRSRLLQTLRILHHDLQTRYLLPAPRILVAGLNPHAGEGGHLGGEEIEIITPVIEALRREGMQLTGPLPADTLFTPRQLDQADAVLAMYHDQGLPVLKHAGFGRAVNVTLGLPIIRTSVDHGTALDLAGTGRADPGSLHAAVAEARRMIVQDA